MKAQVLFAFLCLVGASATQSFRGGIAVAGQQRQRALEQEWSSELDDPDTKVVAYKSPVKRVLNLLGKMKAQLEAEANNESEMYDKMVCWCETNNKEKTQAIADAEAKDLDLSSEIEGRAARFGKLSTEIASMKEQIAKDKAALDKATAIRESEAAKFRDVEKELIQCVANLRNAIAVLAKHHGGSLLQSDGSLYSSVRVIIHEAALKYEMLLAGKDEDGKNQPHAFQSALLQANREADGMSRQLLSALDVKAPQLSLPVKFAERVLADSAKPAESSNFLQGEKQPDTFQSYAPRSGQIFGILQQMKDEFEADLTAEQQAELKAQTDFEAMAKAKKAQIEAGKKKLDDMEDEHANNQKALSDAKEDLEQVRAQRSNDVEFLRNLKVTCNDLDTEWQRRSATRSAEIVAISDAIKILTEDDNRETLARGVTFLQERSVNANAESLARHFMAEALLSAAKNPDFDADDLLADWHGRSIGPDSGPRAQLSTLAQSVRLDSFTKVKEVLDKMLTNLKAQQEEETKLKAYCVKEIDENEKETYAKSTGKNDLETKLEQLANLLKQLADEIAQAKSEIATAKVEIKKAGQNRETENAAFQATVSDQRATQTILKKALTRLQDFYEKGIGKKVIYLQQGQTPPVKFNKYKEHAGGNTVISLLQQIIEDSVTLEAEATKAEAKAQVDYENFVRDSNAVIAGLSDAVVAKQKASADAQVDSSQAQGDLDNTISELESLAQNKADLHEQCDFVLKNFEIRQKARMDEMEAIQSAKAILSGANPAM